MIIDSSAIIAIVSGEPERAAMLDLALDAKRCAMSSATYVECGIVIDRRGDPVLSRRYDELLAELRVELEPVTEAQARTARSAYRDFGKGSGHPAGLNLGDCFSYALAIDQREPLLYKGDDFGHTDVESAL